MITATDVFRGPNGRAWVGTWRFTPTRPLGVELELVPDCGRGGPVLWVLARDLLAPGVRAAAGGDVILIGDGPRLLVVLYPLTGEQVTLAGDRQTVEQFLVATERLVPRCTAPARCVGCVECDTVSAGLGDDLRARAVELGRLERQWLLPAAQRRTA